MENTDYIKCMEKCTRDFHKSRDSASVFSRVRWCERCERSCERWLSKIQPPSKGFKWS